MFAWVRELWAGYLAGGREHAAMRELSNMRLVPREKREDGTARKRKARSLLVRRRDGGKSALHEAAAWGDVGRVEKALAAIDIEDTDDEGMTALHWAASTRATANAMLLLDRGADPRALTNGGREPIHCAADGGDDELIARLLAAGVPIDARGGKGTALAEAARAGHADCVRLLLAKGARAGRGSTLLHDAAATGDRTTYRLLVEAGMDPTMPDHTGRTPAQILDGFMRREFEAKVGRFGT